MKNHKHAADKDPRPPQGPAPSRKFIQGTVKRPRPPGDPVVTPRDDDKMDSAPVRPSSGSGEGGSSLPLELDTAPEAKRIKFTIPSRRPRLSKHDKPRESRNTDCIVDESPPTADEIRAAKIADKNARDKKIQHFGALYRIKSFGKEVMDVFELLKRSLSRAEIASLVKMEEWKAEGQFRDEDIEISKQRANLQSRVDDAVRFYMELSKAFGSRFILDSEELLRLAAKALNAKTVLEKGLVIFEKDAKSVATSEADARKHLEKLRSAWENGHAGKNPSFVNNLVGFHNSVKSSILMTHSSLSSVQIKVDAARNFFREEAKKVAASKVIPEKKQHDKREPHVSDDDEEHSQAGHDEEEDSQAGADDEEDSQSRDDEKDAPYVSDDDEEVSQAGADDEEDLQSGDDEEEDSQAGDDDEEASQAGDDAGGDAQAGDAYGEVAPLLNGDGDRGNSQAQNDLQPASTIQGKISRKGDRNLMANLESYWNTVVINNGGIEESLKKILKQTKCRWCWVLSTRKGARYTNICITQKSGSACILCTHEGIVCEKVVSKEKIDKLPVRTLPGTLNFASLWAFITLKDENLELCVLKAFMDRSRTRCLTCVLNPIRTKACDAQRIFMDMSISGKPVALAAEFSQACDTCKRSMAPGSTHSDCMIVMQTMVQVQKQVVIGDEAVIQEKQELRYSIGERGSCEKPPRAMVIYPAPLYRMGGKDDIQIMAQFHLVEGALKETARVLIAAKQAEALNPPPQPASEAPVADGAPSPNDPPSSGESEVAKEAPETESHAQAQKRPSMVMEDPEQDSTSSSPKRPHKRPNLSMGPPGHRNPDHDLWSRMRSMSVEDHPASWPNNSSLGPRNPRHNQAGDHEYRPRDHGYRPRDHGYRAGGQGHRAGNQGDRSGTWRPNNDGHRDHRNDNRPSHWSPRRRSYQRW